MDKPILKDSMRLFQDLGAIKSRSMFGGFGLFADDIMFGLVVGNELHIRADEKTSKQFEQQGLKPYVYKKRGFPVVTKYFAISDELWNAPDSVLIIAKNALESAKQDKAHQDATKTARLKDLPNLRLATERMLKKAGIETVEDLEQTGAASAFKAIQSSQKNEVSLELLWSLEGAIKGTHWSVVTPDRRKELLSSIQ